MKSETKSYSAKNHKNKSGPVINVVIDETSQNLFDDETKNLGLAPKKKVPKYYLTNADLLPAVLEAKEKGRITDRLGRMLLLLTDRYSRKANFNGYSYREDMVSAAIINLVQNALKFDPEKSQNPFAFYTTAIKNSFLQYMLEEKKQRYIRDQLLCDEGQEASYSFNDSYQNSDDSNYIEVISQEQKVIESNPFRRKVEESKAKKTKRQQEKEQKDKSLKTFLTF